MPIPNNGQHGSPMTAIIPANCIRLSGDVKQVIVPPQRGPGEPQIELIREGDVVQAVDIHCVCGQRIRLVCDYG